MTAEADGADRDAAGITGGAGQQRLADAAATHRSDARPARAQTKKGHQAETEHEDRR